MKTKTDSDRYFRTCSFPLITFLYAKEQQIVGINQINNSGKKEFCFLHSEELQDLVYKYKFGGRNDPGLFVSALVYEQARRELLDRLND